MIGESSLNRERLVRRTMLYPVQISKGEGRRHKQWIRAPKNGDDLVEESPLLA